MSGACLSFTFDAPTFLVYNGPTIMPHQELIPARDRDSKRLMIMLHGLGDSIEGYRWLPEAMGLPWMNYLLVNAPDEYYGGYSWFDFAGNIVPGVERSRRLLFDLLDSLRTKGFPIEQITFGGFSQGCLMSIEVGLRYPHRFAGIVGISGYAAFLDRLEAEMNPQARRQAWLIVAPMPKREYARGRARVRHGSTSAPPGSAAVRAPGANDLRGRDYTCGRH